MNKKFSKKDVKDRHLNNNKGFQEEPNKKWIYFFDLDGTLFKSNCSFSFGKFLYRKNHLSFLAVFKLSIFFLGHRMGLCSMRTLHETCFKAIFLNKHKPVYTDLSADFITTLKGSLIRSVYSQFQNAKKIGHKAIILSSSPDFLVKAIGDNLGADFSMGSEYVTSDENHFIKVGQILDGKRKADLISKFCDHYQIPLCRTVAFSDSSLDLEFLRKANVAKTIFPDKKLKNEALLRGWTILE